MTTPAYFGIDVAKAELVIASSADPALKTIENAKKSIRSWVKELPEGSHVAIEPTSSYHREIASQCHAAGHRVYLLDGYQVSNYRKSVRGRAKTDACDARLLLRLLSNEQEDLTPWSPPPKEYDQLQDCLRLRAKLVKCRTALRQSHRSRSAQIDLGDVFDALDEAVKKADEALQQITLSTSMTKEYRLCQQIPGIGRITASGIVGSYLRGSFRNSDAFIAYIGMDVCARDSGTFQGRRRLSKQGSPELRRLLYNAAMAAKKTSTWAAYYQSYIDRGLKKTQALVILGRKLARVAFAIIRSGQPYQPGREAAGMA